MDRRNALAERLHSIAIGVLRHAREADRESGLGPARLSALSVLVYGGDSTLGALAAAEHVTAPTMTRVVQGLEKAGLAERERSQADARSTVVRATKKGRAVLERARRARLKRIEGLLAGADSEAIDALYASLGAIFG